MKKINISMILTCFIISSSFAQDIVGKWYEVKDSTCLFEITIDKNDDEFGGSYSIQRNYDINILNAPIDTIIKKNDSLIIGLTSLNRGTVFRLKFDKREGAYKGNAFVENRSFSVVLSKFLPKIDLTIRKTPEKRYTRQDSLRGSVTPERVWWDASYYKLNIKLDVKEKRIKGSNIIQYKVLKSNNIMQIDLQQPLAISKVIQNDKRLQFEREGNAYFIQLKSEQKIGTKNEIEIFYEGIPQEAISAPWDGGFTWSKDKTGKPWIATSCQGVGASLWWPNKDHMYDEVDSMTIQINIPEGLTAVSNGQLLSTNKEDDRTITYQWFVKNPINNYGVNLNVGDYFSYSDEYNGEKGKLKCDYYVLKNNVKEAKKQFKQAHLMLEAFEYWFGPYPFYEDGYKLVHVPYLGMEHQSSVTYGNGFKNGYRGRDLSGTGWGMTFDFIIIHESGHEWFANNITYKDIADMWVHESFTNYSESLFVEYFYGKDAGQEYVRGVRKNINNDKPMIGNYDVNDDDYSRDIYYKGGNMLNTLRTIIDNDDKWRGILRGLNKTFYHKTVNTYEIEDYICDQTGLDLKPFFDQYLRTTQIPTLEYYFKEGKFIYRWSNAIPEFDMPLKISIDDKIQWVYPKTNWTEHYMKITKDELVIDPNFYVAEFRAIETETTGGINF